MAKKLRSYFVIQAIESEGVSWFWGEPIQQDRFTKTNDIKHALQWPYKSQANTALSENKRYFPSGEVKEVIIALR